MNAIAVLATMVGVLATVIGLALDTFSVAHAVFFILCFAGCGFLLWDAEQDRKNK
jgi:hypothetical protein